MPSTSRSNGPRRWPPQWTWRSQAERRAADTIWRSTSPSLAIEMGGETQHRLQDLAIETHGAFSDASPLRPDHRSAAVLDEAQTP